MIPTPLDQLGSTPFSFYPPIVNIEHNEWIFRRSTWDEIQVVNTKTATELCVPRNFVGELSLVGEPVLIVGLLKELEYREGVVYPHIRRVIEMPRAVNDSPRRGLPARDQVGARAPEPARPAVVVGIRLESSGRARTVLGAVAAGLLACFVGLIFRDGAMTSRALTMPVRLQVPFTAQDDYDSIVRRLGPPAEDQWRSAKGIDYRRLWYPRQAFAVILMDGRYRGALDANGRVLHSAGPSAPLRNLP